MGMGGVAAASEVSTIQLLLPLRWPRWPFSRRSVGGGAPRRADAGRFGICVYGGSNGARPPSALMRWLSFSSRGMPAISPKEEEPGHRYIGSATTHAQLVGRTPR